MRHVTVMPRAARQAAAAARWWKNNRDKAPEAFEQDLADGLRRIAENATVGSRTPQAAVRKILLERIRYYLYLRVISDHEIQVISVWHASRRPPHL